MIESELYKLSTAFLKELLIKRLPANSKIFLFGSRVQGNYSTSSDLDIGIESENLSPVLLTELKEVIEESFIPYHVDLVDFLQVSDSFRREALKYIEMKTINIYQGFFFPEMK